MVDPPFGRYIGDGRDNALSKINADYETSLYAAMASFIIHI
jgi:hypothetical protein